MSQIGSMLWDMKGYFVFGAIVLAIGSAVFMAGRSIGPDLSRTTRWVAFPMMGCGGCLMLVPLFSVAGGLVLFGGVVAVCSKLDGC